MKKFSKILSLFLSISILFTACGKITPDTAKSKFKDLLEGNDYGAAKAYILSIDKEVVAEMSEDCLEIIVTEFKKIYAPYEKNDIFDLTLADKDFLEKCVKLWSVAAEFTPDDELKFNSDLQYLRYFNEMSNYMQYKEMFLILKDMAGYGYFYNLQKALSDYASLGEYELFDVEKRITENFNYTNYNPQEYYIAEMRDACEKINKYLTSASNGFATNDTSVIASAINNIYEIAETFLYACDCAETVYNALNEALNTFRTYGAFAEYKKTLSFGNKRPYTADTEFPLSIFGETYSPVEPDNSENINQETDTLSISKAEAVRIAVNAVNKTKAYKSEITVNRSQTVNIQMTEFKTESEIASSVSLVRMKINDALKSKNGTSSGSKHFTNGISDGIMLNDVIPPSGKQAGLDLSLIEDYTAVKGSGGYVITFNLKACTSSNTNSSATILTFVDGFYFDTEGANISHKTYYGPSTVSLVINNSGCLSKYYYSISGAANCKFMENGEQVGTGEFSFKQQYNYGFVY